MKRLFAVLILLWAATPASAQSLADSYAKAQDLFNLYIRMEQSYNVELATLYADDAAVSVIELRGNDRYKTTMTGAQFKPLVASYLPVAAQLGEYFTYTNVTLLPEGDKVRILASRASHLKGYSYPYMMLVGPNAAGTWMIWEELSMVKPE